MKSPPHDPESEGSEKPEELSKLSKTAYGIGGYAEHNLNNTVNMMANPVLNVCLGVNPVLVGAALSIPRLWDAFTDPVMGAISDRFDSRFGRRKPFILIGGFFSALFFFLMWMMPRGMGDGTTFAFFLVMSLLFYTAFTVFGVPYNALGLEMSPDYGERTVIQTYRAIFSFTSGFAIQWMYWLTQRDCFSDTLHGMRWVAGGSGLMLFAFILMPVFFCKERNVIREGSHEVSVLKSIKETLTCRPFVLVVMTIVLVLCGILLVMQMALYINVYYLFDGNQDKASVMFGVVGTTFKFSNLVAMPIVCYYANRLGKRKVLITILAIAAAGSLGKWFFYDPENPWLQLIPAILTAPGLGAIWGVANAMIADVCDYDEFVHGTRREGMFGAVQSWANKLAVSISLLLAGFILNFTGFDANLAGPQTVETITRMRALDALVPAVAVIGACVFLAFYPLSHDKVNRLRRILEWRRARNQNP